MFAAFANVSCVEKTIRVGDPVVRPMATPALRVESNIRLDEFYKLCNFVPDGGDRLERTGPAGAAETVRVTLGTGKRRQNPQAIRTGCEPGRVYVFTGPELRLAEPQG